MRNNQSKISLFFDCGAPSIYNKLVRKGGRTETKIHTGSYLKNRKHDDFGYIKTNEYKKYRDDYIEFIKEKKDVIDIYSNLDVINNPKATWENQKIMEKAGLSPMPVFHAGNGKEHNKWLRKYIAAGYTHIGLAGGFPNPIPVVEKMYDPLWQDILTDKDGMPVIKVHGYAVTSIRMMWRYPWYSVDSTSWVMTSRTGSIYVPKRRNGKYIYSEDSLKICVSNRTASKKTSDRWNINTIKTKQRGLFDDILTYLNHKGMKLGETKYKVEKRAYKLKKNERWLKSDIIQKWMMAGKRNKAIKKDLGWLKPIGKDECWVEVRKVLGVSNDYMARDEANIIYFQDVEKAMPKWPWRFKTERKTKGGLFKVYEV
jgi:hypothetical protein